MRFETSVALRYLAASRRRAHVALIAGISVAGLAVGVAALVVSLALLSGFQDRIRRQMMDRTAHLRVSAGRGARLADPDRVRAALEAVPGVKQVSPAIEGRAWASNPTDPSAIPVPLRYRSAASASTAAGKGGARITGAIAARLHLGTGDTIRLASSRSRLSPIGPLPVTAVVPVDEVRRGSALDKPGEIEVSVETARLLSDTPAGAAAYEARLADPESAAGAARGVARSLGAGYRVETWRELNGPLAFALRLEKSVIFLTVALVILVAALNIVANIALTVVEKKRDLGVFTAMGAAPESVLRIYLTLGAAIGAIGTLGGLIIGIGLSVALERFRLVPLPSDVYLLSHVPFAVHPAEVAVIAAFAFATALAAAVLPARAAARLAPGEAIRLSR
ncbi:MAG TPA: FtsX-like permease family protein [Thermoanaerobaculia bacterium]|nr:FtsX-like permease family protein [Thermoanaerobaculia bacterium]